jgi:putative DNA primase/helicase
MTGTFEDILKEAKAKAKAKAPKGFELVRAQDVKIQSKDWLWIGHLLRGAQELLSGIPGLGKSQVQCHLVACVTAGKPWPDGAAGMEPANVIMLTAEDTLGQEVVPRLKAAGADLTRVHIVKCIRSEGANRQFLLGEDLDALEQMVKQVSDVALITVDPITAYMGGTMDSHKSTEVRSQLGPLKDFAEKMNVAISTITHPAKSASQKAMDHFIGSQAFIAAGRIGHVCIEEIAEDGGKTGRILFANAKNNPHTKMPTLAFRITEIVVGQDPDTHMEIGAPRVEWEKEAVEITADEAVAAAAGHGEKAPRGAQKQVQEFLSHILKEGQPVPVKQVYAEAEQRGFSKQQLRTAFVALRVQTHQLETGGWAWQLIAF